MLQGEPSAILSTFIKPRFVIKIFVLSVFEWPFYAGFTVLHSAVQCSWRNVVLRADVLRVVPMTLLTVGALLAVSIVLH